MCNSLFLFHIFIVFSVFFFVGEPISITTTNLYKQNSGRYNTDYRGNYSNQGINQNRNSVTFDDKYIPYYYQNA